MQGFDKIIEQRIQEAINNGEFDNLDLKGQVLDFSYLKSLPEDVRMGYTILKNSGLLPEEMQLKKEIYSIEELINSSKLSGVELETEKEKLKNKLMRYKMMMEKRKSSSK